MSLYRDEAFLSLSLRSMSPSSLDGIIFTDFNWLSFHSIAKKKSSCSLVLRRILFSCFFVEKCSPHMMLLMIGTFVLFERDLERRTEVSEKRLEIIEAIWTHIKASFNFKEMNLWLECILYLLPFGLQKTTNRIRLFRSSCCIYTYSTTRSTSSETMHAISFQTAEEREIERKNSSRCIITQQRVWLLRPVQKWKKKGE